MTPIDQMNSKCGDPMAWLGYIGNPLRVPPGTIRFFGETKDYSAMHHDAALAHALIASINEMHNENVKFLLVKRAMEWMGDYGYVDDVPRETKDEK